MAKNDIRYLSTGFLAACICTIIAFLFVYGRYGAAVSWLERGNFCIRTSYWLYIAFIFLGSVFCSIAGYLWLKSYGLIPYPDLKDHDAWRSMGNGDYAQYIKLADRPAYIQKDRWWSVVYGLLFFVMGAGVVCVIVTLPPVLMSNSEILTINASPHSFGPQTILDKQCIQGVVLRKIKGIVIGKKKKRSGVYCVLRHVMHCCCTAECAHHFISPRYFPFSVDQLLSCLQYECGLRSLE